MKVHSKALRSVKKKLFKIYPPLANILTPDVHKFMNSTEIEFSQFIWDHSFVWNIGDLCLLADDYQYANINAVFAPHPESVFLSKLISDPYGTNKFLDVGIGSGILSISAAKKGWQCYGVDINNRAITLAKLNARLNNVSISAKHETLAHSFTNNDIQLCIANLPFESTPEGYSNYLHSDGGLYGDKFITPFLNQLERILSQNGTAIIPAFSLYSNRKSRFEIALASDKLNCFERGIIRISDPIDIRILYKRYPGSKWKYSYERLKREGYLYFSIDIAFLKYTKTNKGRFEGVFEIPIAGEDWIFAIGTKKIGKPNQNNHNL